MYFTDSWRIFPKPPTRSIEVFCNVPLRTFWQLREDKNDTLESLKALFVEHLLLQPHALQEPKSGTTTLTVSRVNKYFYQCRLTELHDQSVFWPFSGRGEGVYYTIHPECTAIFGRLGSHDLLIVWSLYCAEKSRPTKMYCEPKGSD